MVMPERARVRASNWRMLGRWQFGLPPVPLMGTTCLADHHRRHCPARHLHCQRTPAPCPHLPLLPCIEYISSFACKSMNLSLTYKVNVDATLFKKLHASFEHKQKHLLMQLLPTSCKKKKKRIMNMHKKIHVADSSHIQQFSIVSTLVKERKKIINGKCVTIFNIHMHNNNTNKTKPGK